MSHLSLFRSKSQMVPGQNEYQSELTFKCSPKFNRFSQEPSSNEASQSTQGSFIEVENGSEFPSPNASPAGKRLIFDFPDEKENRDPNDLRKTQINDKMNPLSVLKLKRNQTDSAMEEEKKEEKYFCFSQEAPSRDIFSFGNFKKSQFTRASSTFLNFDSLEPQTQSQPTNNEDDSNSIWSLTLSRIQSSEFCEPQLEPQPFESDDFSNSDSQNLDSNFAYFESPPLALPTVKNLRNPELNTISARTVADVLASNNNGNPFIIVDCRYDYEYDGGHIQGAINIRSPEVLERLFFINRSLLYHPDYLQSVKNDFESVINKLEGLENLREHISDNTPAPLIIFHCEFSQKRGPRALNALRSLDRKINYNKFPYLHYPQLYIIEGGYRNFHSEHPELCVGPLGTINKYTEMTDKDYQSHYFKSKAFEKRHWKKKTSIFEPPSLFRAKTISEI